MTKIDIVMGANWGDEGKGLVTNALATKDSLIVFSSNSCQRGHTVVHNGIRHVFRHFGSGTLKGAATYFTGKFIINPTLFRQELQELWAMNIYPKVYYNPACRVVTPYDMLANQVIEMARGDERHGSCGCGVWETVCRDNYLTDIRGYNSFDVSLRYPEEFCSNTLNNIIQYYLDERASWSTEMKDFIQGPFTRERVESDIEFFLKWAQPIPLCGEKRFLHSFNHIIFENSQGLLLDMDYMPDPNHTTPAHIGSKIPTDIILHNFDKTEVEVNGYYVTRSYFTRHGAGEMGSNGECLKESINPLMEDLTNQPNPWQGNLRYGKISEHDAMMMYCRIKADYNRHLSLLDGSINVVITHANEYTSDALLEIFKANREVNIFNSYNEQTIQPVFFNF